MISFWELEEESLSIIRKGFDRLLKGEAWSSAVISSWGSWGKILHYLKVRVTQDGELGGSAHLIRRGYEYQGVLKVNIPVRNLDFQVFCFVLFHEVTHIHFSIDQCQEFGYQESPIRRANRKDFGDSINYERSPVEWECNICAICYLIKLGYSLEDILSRNRFFRAIQNSSKWREKLLSRLWREGILRRRPT